MWKLRKNYFLVIHCVLHCSFETSNNYIEQIENKLFLNSFGGLRLNNDKNTCVYCFACFVKFYSETVLNVFDTHGQEPTHLEWPLRHFSLIINLPTKSNRTNTVLFLTESLSFHVLTLVYLHAHSNNIIMYKFLSSWNFSE